MSSISSPALSDLVQQFETAARTAAASVERVPCSGADLEGAVKRIATGRMAIAETLDLPPELFAGLRRLPSVVTGRSKQELVTIRRCADVILCDRWAAEFEHG